MATHSSILAWEIPWTEEPGGLQSMGLQRVRYDWATNTYTALTHTQHFLIYFLILLKYNWFTMLCLISIYIYLYIFFIYIFFFSLYIYSFSYSFLLQFIIDTEYNSLCTVSRTLLFIHPIYKSLHLLIPNTSFLLTNLEKKNGQPHGSCWVQTGTALCEDDLVTGTNAEPWEGSVFGSWLSAQRCGHVIISRNKNPTAS